MENLTPRVTAALVLALMLAGGSLLAAQPNDFYISLLNRGVANANAGNNAAAIPELRIAAFGLVDNVPAFALAESYLAVVAQRLKLEAEARHAVQRLVAAERIEPTYARLPLSTAVRAELEKIARALLPPEQLALLHGTAPARGTVPPPAPVIATPDPQSVPATAQPAPAPRTLESTPTPAPQPPIVT
ncbi:MAG TPA: hypothetical protein VN605_14120, partial [Thermoanaerobaculia bacterium]|nr:hypothetical protein [Thermoanaerobaculia bacterium]